MINKELIKEYADTEYPIVGDYDAKRYGNDRMNEYVQKKLANVIKLSNGMLCGYDKPSIETRFCFHDEGPDYELYKELMADNDRLKGYFLYHNAKGIDELIEAFEDRDSTYEPCIYDYENGLCRPSTAWRGPDSDKNRVKVSEEDRKAILEMLFEIRKDFIKRLETWWKKYGAEKLHTWTYWADA